MPRRKALKVIVDVECHAVTCPGVFLPERESVFIKISIFGQLQQTQYHPPVFPFLFHERVRFEKVFCSATNPIEIAQELCGESVQIDLARLGYPGHELLGSYSDNARDFLFPTPKVTPTYPGIDREILFERSASFPGIAPKLEFSSRTTIKEVTSSGKQRCKTKLLSSSGRTNKAKASGENGSQSFPQKEKVPARKLISKLPATKRRGQNNLRSRSANRGYEKPTIASRARSPSPYTHRRMAELSLKGPFESATQTNPFKTVINSRPEFTVRKVAEDSFPADQDGLHLCTTPQSVQLDSPSSLRNSCRISLQSSDNTDVHILKGESRTPNSDSLTIAHSSYPKQQETRICLRDLDTGPASTFDRLPSATRTSILNRTSLEERLQGQPSPYEKIRDRVRALLQSPQAAMIAETAMRDGEDRYRHRLSRSPRYY